MIICHELIILYPRPGLKPKFGNVLETVLISFLKGLQWQYPVLLSLSFNIVST